jgi:tellurite resistance protein
MEGIYDIKAQMDERLAQKEKEAEKLQYEETIYQLRKDAERKERAHEQAIERLKKRRKGSVTVGFKLNF